MDNGGKEEILTIADAASAIKPLAQQIIDSGAVNMTNAIGRLIAAAIAMVAGAVACTASGLDIRVGITILLVATALFAVEYFRMQKS